MAKKKRTIKFKADFNLEPQIQDDISSSIEEQIEQEVKKKGFSVDDIEDFKWSVPVEVKIRKLKKVM